MKIVQINGGVFGSTGAIMHGISQAARAAGHEVLCFSPVTSTNRNREPAWEYRKIGSYRSRQANVLMARVTGDNGCFARAATSAMLREIATFGPDVIQLHTLHDSYLNLPMLFDYIKKNAIRTVWTLHDCWAFTGHCVHFTLAGCHRWKTECCDCPQHRAYPMSYTDNSRKMYRRKKAWFTGVKDLTIVTPSHWLADLVRQSYLKEYPIKVIHNGIDLDVFKPTESDFKARHGLENKRIVLGVSFGWGYSKGLDVFKTLAETLPEEYRVVLVGTDDAVDADLPSSILSVHRTQDQRELAEIYSAADVFVNPTREDTYPTVNMESIACGTPVVAFRTGGSPESLDEASGMVVDCDRVDLLTEGIIKTCNGREYGRGYPLAMPACLERAPMFDKRNVFEEYVKIYSE